MSKIRHSARILVALFTATGVLSAADRASAQEASVAERSDDGAAWFNGAAAFNETGFYTGHPRIPGAPTEGRLSVTTSVFGAKLVFLEHLELIPQLGIVNSRTEGQSTTRVGNPILAVSYIGRSGRLRYRLGVYAVMPGARANKKLDKIGFMTAMGMTGVWNGELWAADRAGGAALTSASVSLSHQLRITAASLAGALRPVRGEGSRTWIVWHQSLSVRYSPTRALTLGMRFVGFQELGEGTEVFSVEPSVTGILGPIFVGARLTLPLDRPFGPAFSEGGAWGLNVLTGISFGP